MLFGAPVFARLLLFTGMVTLTLHLSLVLWHLGSEVDLHLTNLREQVPKLIYRISASSRWKGLQRTFRHVGTQVANEDTVLLRSICGGSDNSLLNRVDSIEGDIFDLLGKSVCVQ